MTETQTPRNEGSGAFFLAEIACLALFPAKGQVYSEKWKSVFGPTSEGVRARVSNSGCLASEQDPGDSTKFTTRVRGIFAQEHLAGSCAGVCDRVVGRDDGAGRAA